MLAPIQVTNRFGDLKTIPRPDHVAFFSLNESRNLIREKLWSPNVNLAIAEYDRNRSKNAIHQLMKYSHGRISISVADRADRIGLTFFDAIRAETNCLGLNLYELVAEVFELSQLICELHRAPFAHVRLLSDPVGDFGDTNHVDPSQDALSLYSVGHVYSLPREKFDKRFRIIRRFHNKTWWSPNSNERSRHFNVKDGSWEITLKDPRQLYAVPDDAIVFIKGEPNGSLHGGPIRYSQSGLRLQIDPLNRSRFDRVYL